MKNLYSTACGNGQTQDAQKNSQESVTQKSSESSEADSGESDEGGSQDAGGQASQTSSEADPLGKYEEEITLTTVRTLDHTVKFDETNPNHASLEENIWHTYQEELGINLEYLWTPDSGQYEQKWNAALATGDIPDFAMVSENIYRQLVEADMVADMTDIFDTYANDLYKQYLAEENYLSAKFITDSQGIPYTGTTLKPWKPGRAQAAT